MVVGAGASGAIFGLAGAAIAVFYLGHLPIAKSAIRSTMRSLMTFVGYNLLFGLAPGIDNSAHIGGLVAGLAMGAALSKHILVAPEVRRDLGAAHLDHMAVLLLLANIGIRRMYPQIPLLANPQVVASQQLAAAQRALLQRRPDEAIAYLQEVIEALPQAPEPRYLLGEAYLMQRNPDKAIQAFQQALQLNPEYGEAAAGLGRAYMAKGMNAEAERGI